MTNIVCGTPSASLAGALGRVKAVAARSSVMVLDPATLTRGARRAGYTIATVEIHGERHIAGAAEVVLAEVVLETVEAIGLVAAIGRPHTLVDFALRHAGLDGGDELIGLNGRAARREAHERRCDERTKR